MQVGVGEGARVTRAGARVHARRGAVCGASITRLLGGGAALEAKPVLVRLGAILGSNLVMLAPKTHSSLLRRNRNLCWLGLGL